MTVELDAIDIAIVETLQRDGRIQNAKLAGRVGLSPSPCLSRVRRLERIGVVDRYVAIVDPVRLSPQHVVVHTEITLGDRRAATTVTFERLIRRTPEALSCDLVSGDYDYLVKFACRSMDAFAGLIQELCDACPAIRTHHSFVSILRVKDTTELPVHLLAGR